MGEFPFVDGKQLFLSMFFLSWDDFPVVMFDYQRVFLGSHRITGSITTVSGCSTTDGQSEGFVFFFRKRRSEKSPCSHQTSLELDFNQRQLIVQNSFNPGFYFFSVRSSSIKKRLQAIKESQLIAMAGSSPIESHDYVGLEPSGMRDRKPHGSSGSSMKRGGSFYEAFDLEMVQNVPQLRP